MLNLIYGITSIIKKPNRYKFIGIFFVIVIMFIAAKTRLYSEFPQNIVKAAIFWLVLPTYLCILGANYKNKYVPKNNNNIETYKNNNEDVFNNINTNNVSHIERKTKKTTTIETTETIYFRESEMNYIE